MTRRIFLSLSLLLPLLAADAQQQWTLDECIDYALRNSIDVQQSSLQREERQVQLSTARNSRLPSLDASLSSNMYFGRGPGRDGTYKDNNQLSASVGVSASVPVFQGMRIRHQIEGSRLDLGAAAEDLAAVREDVALNVTALYLQALLDKELVKVAQGQLALSEQLVERSRALVASGKKPESELYESEAVRARDELSLTQARASLMLSLLELSQALNRPSAEGFDIREPQIDDPMLASMSRLELPDAVYGYASAHRPHILAEELRLQSSLEGERVARAGRYPQVALSAGYGNSFYRAFASQVLNSGFWTQLRNNGNEYVGLSIAIPIFNRMATRNQIRSAALGVRNRELALDQARRTLRKEIEQAYYNAEAAYGKFRSAEKALGSARLAFRYIEQKTEAGRATVFDFNDAKNRMQQAESQAVQSKYEFVFRCKILDFYAGKPLGFARY